MSVYDDAGLALTLDDASFAGTPLQPSISNAGETTSGLGSLADELAGAFGDDYEDDDEEDYDEEGQYGDDGEDNEVPATGTTTPPPHLPNGTTSPSKRTLPAVRRPPSASDYEGSDYGDGSDTIIEEGGISHGLEEKLETIERLAIHHKMLLNEEDNTEEGGGVIPRLMDGLQNLLPQNQLETASTRLTTAHSALSSNMWHQTRTLRELGFAINSASLPPPETADLLISLIDLIPRPTIQPLAELSNLSNLTLSLANQLSLMSDSLHMARQSSIAAHRKLRVAKEACADWRNEIEMVEKARRWIEDGDWDAKCERRDAAVVCRDVTCGFEDFCKGYEEKLRLLL
ncbi:hypothetical protein BDD12DRAFT_811735 [Trichophaea hybrida]|nr:hypothetical protein BDD12DRAFT_811735 [Trichophaea hybrida]